MIWLCAPPKIARVSSASSTATPNRRRLPYETPHPRPAWRRSQLREHLGGCFLRPCRSRLLSLASQAAVLRPPPNHSRTEKTSTPFSQRTSLLHPQNTAET